MKTILCKDELCREWKTTTGQIALWIAEGMPHNIVWVGKKKTYEFDLEECQRWYRRYAW